VRSMREYELAVSLYRDENNARGAIIALERSLQLDPDNPESLLLLGQIYGSAELYDRAETPLRKAAEILRNETARDPSRGGAYGEARNALAATLINLGKADEAVLILRELADDVHYAPQHLAYGNLGWALLSLGQYREAAQALERAVVNRAEFCVGHYRLGAAYFHLDEHGLALEALNRALSNPAPGCARIQPAYRYRGQVHLRLQQQDAAREDLTRCRDLDPRSSDGQVCATALSALEGP
jgi:type IV pilus assembly protein PilF